jgi:hypothetical protein
MKGVKPEKERGEKSGRKDNLFFKNRDFIDPGFFYLAEHLYTE